METKITNGDSNPRRITRGPLIKDPKICRNCGMDPWSQPDPQGPSLIGRDGKAYAGMPADDFIQLDRAWRKRLAQETTTALWVGLVGGFLLGSFVLRLVWLCVEHLDFSYRWLP